MHTPIELRDEERTRCEVWTRVMGYHRPISAFNPGKQSEQAERCYYKEAKIKKDTHKTLPDAPIDCNGMSR
ncbi:MAG: anaerobic ribonucleoside-triphosphate reductase [Candidatus Thiodiazotropha sp. (ex Codakia rugifera)]|nr:anaerobic ribonucleoside-triphosphate reductase [Candidatus Thiodiazotropha sp. (ex Codakia rugifera)]